MKQIIITLLLSLTAVVGFAQLSAKITVDRTDTTYCLGDTVFFTNASTGDYVTEHWIFGDSTDTWTHNPFHIYQKPGKYDVTLIIADTAQNKDTAQITVIVNPSPQLQLINNQAQHQLIAHVIDPQNTTFSWYLNSTLTNATDTLIYYYESGTYAVTAVNQYNCKDSAAIEIVLNTSTTTTNDTLSIHVANNILTPNNDGINDVLFIQDLANFSRPCQVFIYNKLGRLVYQNTNYTNVGGFDGHDNNGKLLPAGTYYYIIRSEGKKTATGFIDIIR